MKTLHKQLGISVIEIMIAVAISLILLAGIMQIFLSNKHTYRVQEAFSRLQENGRYGIQFLTKDLRMAGFFGCASAIEEPNNLVDFNNDDNPDDVAGFSGNGLSGYQYSDLPLALNSSTNLTTADVLPNTDILQIKRGSNTGIYVKENVLTKKANIKLDPVLATGVFNQNDILFITDCEAADIFAATGISTLGSGTTPSLTIAHAENSNLTQFLSKVYDNNAEVMKLVSHLYYIGNNSANVPTLFRASLGNNATIIKEELVEGVENMQLMYGVDTNDDNVADKYFVDSDLVTDFTQVLNVRITLKIQTIEDNIAAEVNIDGDRRLRRDFTTSVTIRNRVI